eukprot:gene5620-6804_t
MPDDTFDELAEEQSAVEVPGSYKAYFGVGLLHLFQGGYITNELKLYYKGNEFAATITPEGRVLNQLLTEVTLNNWCITSMRSVVPTRKAVDAWHQVKAVGGTASKSQGAERLLNEFRKEFVGLFEPALSLRGPSRQSAPPRYTLQDGSTLELPVELNRCLNSGRPEDLPVEVPQRPTIDKCTEQQFIQDLVLFLLSQWKPSNGEKDGDGKRLAQTLMHGGVLLNRCSLDAFNLYRSVVAHGGFPPPRTGPAQKDHRRYGQRFSWASDIFPRLRNFSARSGNLTSVGNCLINQYLRYLFKRQALHLMR